VRELFILRKSIQSFDNAMSKDFPEKLYLPKGFRFSALAAGIKPSGKPDLALVIVPNGATAAAVFTRNRVAAAPVILGREHLKGSRGKVKAVVVNAGNANCSTGIAGYKAATAVCKSVAEIIHTNPGLVIPSSTGVIGVPFPTQKIIEALPNAISAAQEGIKSLENFARAIMTTDTKPKVASAQLRMGGKIANVVGVAKGAGMIHPDMATMLVYLFTDVEATVPVLKKTLYEVADKSFNNISVDGDTSTNDTVLLLANGASKIKLQSVSARKKFTAALHEVCYSLAHQIVSDGEGVKHVIHLTIEQARSDEEARRVARTLATSALLKTAWAGADPNWGRMLAALGRSGVNFDPQRVNVFIGPHQVCRNGSAHSFDHANTHKYMQQPEYEICLQLGTGRKALEFLTCDLTEEYVRINAEYTT
jgi:glutamate N-acetyltransferase/amino-acid N-acetyltransferase